METTPMMPVTGAPTVLPAADKKEMLSVSHDGKRPVVRINYSSLEVIQTCKRKARYLLVDGLKSNTESEATLFGRAIHKGLEAWYVRGIEERRVPTAKCNGEVPGGTCPCPRCDAIRAFLLTAAPLEAVNLADKRHPSNGIRILDYYIRKYIDDPFEVLREPDGTPMVERRLEATLLDNPELKIILFGTVDVILKNVRDNIVLVTDHKTTSTLGVEFYKRIKPNPQYTAYIWLAQQSLGLTTNLFLVNGLQVAKTKVECVRQITSRDESDFWELKQSVWKAVLDFLDESKHGAWPQSAPNPCSMYGGCQYHMICEANPSIRPQIIRNLYQQKDSPDGSSQHVS